MSFHIFISLLVVIVIVLVALAAHLKNELRIALIWIDMLEARGRYQQEEIQHQQATIRLLRKELLSETGQIGQVIQ